MRKEGHVPGQVELFFDEQPENTSKAEDVLPLVETPVQVVVDDGGWYLSNTVKVCLRCGKGFESTGRNHKYCCNKKVVPKNKVPKERKCAYCEKPILEGSKSYKYCDERCRSLGRRNVERTCKVCGQKYIPNINYGACSYGCVPEDMVRPEVRAELIIGIQNQEPLAMIGKRLGVSRERVRQWLHMAGLHKQWKEGRLQYDLSVKEHKAFELTINGETE